MSGRPMKFPYTYSARLAQFPFKYMWNTGWMFRYYIYGIVASLPLFYWINSKANSPQARANHKEYLRKRAEAEAAAHHGH